MSIIRNILLFTLIAIFYISNFAGSSTAEYRQAPNPQNRAGLYFSEAQDQALKLKPMMTQSQVLELFGKPDETSSYTYGSATDNSWQGITWKYIWRYSQFRFLLKRLEITFQENAGTWVVNSWDWYDK